jgi:beta-phosphoglucomutase-like phosphatase (HAD superfamily)
MSARADGVDLKSKFSLECDAILFDLDGVLVDSTTRVAQTWERWARKHGLDSARVIEAAHGRRTIETVQLVAPYLAATDEVANLEASEASNTDGVFEIPGARNPERLPLDRWAIVTSGIRAVATPASDHQAADAGCWVRGRHPARQTRSGGIPRSSARTRRRSDQMPRD